MQNIYTTSSQKNFFSIEKNNYSIDQDGSRLLSDFSFEYLSTQRSVASSKSSKCPMLKKPLDVLEKGALNNKREHLFRAVEKPLEELRNRIFNVYNEHKKKNWDGYGAEPMKYLDQSLQFADDLFSESRTLVESVDVIPENDGCLCFEWFKSNSKYINISVKGDKLIYTYKLGDEKACGEGTRSAKETIIEQIKKIA